MKFKTAQKMLDYINEGHDLYSRKAETYVFSYNAVGSICTYDIDQKKANELIKQVENSKEENYWSSFLGVGGQIWDDLSHECFEEGQISNLECCEKLLKFVDWILV